MISNETVFANLTPIEKADLALSDLTSSGGLLATAQANEFIRLMIDPAVMLKQVYVKKLRSPTDELDTITMSSGRMLKAGAEATALASGSRVKPDLAKKTMSVALIKGEARISNEAAEDSIERESFVQTVLETMTARAGRDVDELLVNGDTGSGDTFLALFDGMIKLASTNTVAGGTVPLSKTLLRDTLKTMPTQYRQDLAKLKYYTAMNAEVDYKDTVMNRIGVYGDSVFQNGSSVGYGGIPVVGVPVFPTNLGTGTNETDALLLDPKVAVLGVWRDIRVEQDKDVPAGQIIFVFTMRLAFNYIAADAVVKLTGVKVS